MTYTVYSIRNLYVGHTNNIKKRTYQHNYDFKKGKKKILYDYLREIDHKGTIVLTPIKTFNTKVEAKRHEMLLILKDHFGDKQYKQKVPSIRDR